MASRALTAPFRQPTLRPLMGWAALCKADLVALSNSWVLRGWLILLALTEFVALTNTLTNNRVAAVPASVVLIPQLQAFLFVWSTVIIVLSAGAVSLESEIIADGILSRACTRTQYILAKLAARSVAILGIYALVAAAAGFCAWRYATNDMTLVTLLSGISVVGMAVLLLISVGVALSVMFNNTVTSVICMLLLWYVASPIFNFMGAEYLSPSSLMANLPLILKDSTAPRIVSCRATTTSVTLTFSKPMDAEAAEEIANYSIESPLKKTQEARTAVYDRSRTSVLLGGMKLKASETVKVTVSEVADTAGNDLSPAARSATAAVASADGSSSKVGKFVVQTTARNDQVTVRAARAGSGSGVDAAPPRVTGCQATATSLTVRFSEDMQQASTEKTSNYVIESPFGTTLSARTASYDAESRSVVLSGLSLPKGEPVRVTAKNVKDLAGNAIGDRGNLAIYSEVTTWKYVLGFGLPTLAFAALAVGWFSKRDL